MPVEIEAKMSVEGFESLRPRLGELQAKLLGRYLETNTFFDITDRSLLAADKGLRLRLKRNLDTGEDTHIITYKGPRQPGPLEEPCEEVELMVEGSAESDQALGMPGLQQGSVFRKERESYSVGSCEVELDELPFLGTYVEVEGPTEAAVLHVRQMLGLNEPPLIKAGYVSILTSYLRSAASRKATSDLARP